MPIINKMDIVCRHWHLGLNSRILGISLSTQVWEKALAKETELEKTKRVRWLDVKGRKYSEEAGMTNFQKLLTGQ